MYIVVHLHAIAYYTSQAIATSMASPVTVNFEFIIVFGRMAVYL